MTKEELNVLEKGLAYCPTKNFDLFDTVIDINRFVLKILLKKHFFDEDKGEFEKSRIESNFDFKQSKFSNFKQLKAIVHLENLQRDTDPYLGRVGSEIIKNKFKPKSNFYLVYLKDHLINMFQKNVEKELTNLYNEVKAVNNDSLRRENLTNRERQALNNLKKDQLKIKTVCASYIK